MSQPADRYLPAIVFPPPSMGRLELVVDSGKEVYTPEDVVTGRVIANFSDTVNLREVTVCLRCRTLVEVILFFTGSWEYPCSEELNFKIESRVFPPPELSGQGMFSLPKGRHEWHFAFPLASVAPMLIPTCRGRKESSSSNTCFYSVYCDLTVNLRRKSVWKSNLSAVRPLNLMPSIDSFAVDTALPAPTFAKYLFKLRQPSAEQTILSRLRQSSSESVTVQLGALLPPLIAPSPRRPAMQLQLSSPQPVTIESVTIYVVQRIEARLYDCNFDGHASTEHGKVTKTVNRVGRQLDLSKFVADFEFSDILPSFSSNLIRCKHAVVFEVRIGDPQRSSARQILQLNIPVDVASPFERQDAPTYAEALASPL